MTTREGPGQEEAQDKRRAKARDKPGQEMVRQAEGRTDRHIKTRNPISRQEKKEKATKTQTDRQIKDTESHLPVGTK